MNIENFLPSLWRRSETPARRESDFPFTGLQQEMSRMFEDFFRGWDAAPADMFSDTFGKFSPSIDVKEDENEIVVTAELPGLEAKDFEILLSDDTLTIKGEKKEEKETKEKDYHRMERTYGSFHRVISLGAGIDSSKVDAQFKDGVLKILLPRTEQAQSKIKKITVKND